MARFKLLPRRRAKSAPLVTASPRLIELFRAYDELVLSFGSAYRKLAPVRTVVDFLATAVATTPLKFYERTDAGRPRVYDHPVARALRSPAPNLSTYRLLFGTVADLAVYAQAYWYGMKSETGRRMIVPLPPERVQPRDGDVISASEYWYWPGNAASAQPKIIRAEDMVHFRLYDPVDRRTGSSKLEAVRNILREEIAASANREGFWKNAARPAGWIERPVDAPEWTSEDEKRFLEDWRALYSGDAKSGGTPIVADGMKYHPEAFSPRDSEFVQGRKFVLEATARVYGIPLPLLSLTETATYASTREFHKMLYQTTLPPWFEMIQSEIELQMFPWFGEDPTSTNLYAEFDVEAKIRGSFEEQAAVFKDLIGRPIMTAREGRDRLNLEPRDDPRDDELAIPTNNVALIPADGSPIAPTVPAPPPGAADAAKQWLQRMRQVYRSRAGAKAPFPAFGRRINELSDALTKAGVLDGAAEYAIDLNDALDRALTDEAADAASIDRVFTELERLT